MRISDWSSDVCSSDLTPNVTSVTLSTRLRAPRSRMVHDNRITNRGRTRVFENEDRSLPKCVLFGDSFGGNLIAFLRESLDRKSVVSGTSGSVRVDLGGRRIIKKKKQNINMIKQ